MKEIFYFVTQIHQVLDLKHRRCSVGKGLNIQTDFCVQIHSNSNEFILCYISFLHGDKEQNLLPTVNDLKLFWQLDAICIVKVNVSQDVMKQIITFLTWKDTLLKCPADGGEKNDASVLFNFRFFYYE